IPNTAVKLSRVESTGLEAAWEDRLLPVRIKPPHELCGGFFVMYVDYFNIVKAFISSECSC
ncbi:MAG: hypothetical protein IJV18_04345, partial [Acidaminococcaceae bacterium]|nr:hypothetical protein [Acidaminococcaceae bacterium]